MSHQIGMYQIHVIAQRNNCKIESVFLKDKPKYTILFMQDGTEIGRAQVEDWEPGGPEGVALETIRAIFPNDSLFP